MFNINSPVPLFGLRGMGQLKEKWGPRLCSLVPPGIWRKLLGVELVIPHWHVISDQELEHVSGLYSYRNIRQFKADVEYFLKFYVPVSLQDVLSHLDGIGRLPKKSVLFTFDDGFREIYDVVAPILYSQGIPAVFFLIISAIDNHELCYPQKKSLLIHALADKEEPPAKREVIRYLANAGIDGPDFPSRIRSIYYRQQHLLDELGHIVGCDFAAYASSVKPYLTSDQIGDLIMKGFDIGAHSIDHPLYSELSINEQLSQTRESLDYLSQHFKYTCQAFAFPYTDAHISSEFFRQVFADGRLKVTFGTGGMVPHFCQRNLPRFTMERTDSPAAQILARQFGRTFLRRSLRHAC